MKANRVERKRTNNQEKLKSTGLALKPPSNGISFSPAQLAKKTLPHLSTREKKEYKSLKKRYERISTIGGNFPWSLDVRQIKEKLEMVKNNSTPSGKKDQQILADVNRLLGLCENAPNESVRSDGGGGSASKLPKR
jgi:hypothetical protein